MMLEKEIKVNKMKTIPLCLTIPLKVLPDKRWGGKKKVFLLLPVNSHLSTNRSGSEKVPFSLTY